MLLERQARLLFTGDSFYPGPIYLYSPETDFDAYVRSMNRVQKWTNQVDLLLPAHNVAVASPEYLGRVVSALDKIRSGAAPAKSKDGNQEYVFDGFSFILAARSSSAEKRDPFVQMKGDRAPSPSSVPKTLTVGYAVVRGITKRGTEYIALIRGADGKMYSMKVGDRLRDGKILKIDSDAVTFLHYSGKKVRKELHPVGE
jgi:hypothetical protein